MRSEASSIGWGFWVRWAFATILGLAVGMVVFIIVGDMFGEVVDNSPEYVFGLIVGAIFGTAFGIAQWLVLRREIPHSAAWIPATVVGFSVAAFVIFGFLDGGNPDTSVPAKLGHAVVLGGVLGIAQFLVLRDKVKMAAAWIVVSILAWLVAEIIGIALGSAVGPPLDLLGLFLLGGALPGAGMVWLLNRSENEPEVAA